MLSERIGSTDGSLQDAPEGPRLAPRPAHAGQQAASLARLPQETYDSERYKTVVHWETRSSANSGAAVSGFWNFVFGNVHKAFFFRMPTEPPSSRSRYSSEPTPACDSSALIRDPSSHWHPLIGTRLS
jgi:hypothetical protein